MAYLKSSIILSGGDLITQISVFLLKMLTLTNNSLFKNRPFPSKMIKLLIHGLDIRLRLFLLELMEIFSQILYFPKDAHHINGQARKEFVHFLALSNNYPKLMQFQSAMIIMIILIKMLFKAYIVDFQIVNSLLA